MKTSKLVLSLVVLAAGLTATDHALAADKLKALIIDGQNNHAVWPKSTIMMKHYLEETGLFEVEIDRTRFTWKAEREKAFLPLAGVGETEDLKKPKPDPDFKPAFGLHNDLGSAGELHIFGIYIFYFYFILG